MESEVLQGGVAMTDIANVIAVSPIAGAKPGSRMKISIVTPSFNQGNYIEETIKSVLCQQGDFFIDYVIMDGGSTDNSIEIIRRYDNLLKGGALPVKCKGIRYRWVSEKDDGQADALNKGFAAAEGDIGAWLNSDDVYSDCGVLDRVRKYFQSGDIDLLIGNGTLIDEKGNFIGDYRTDSVDLKELLFLDYHILQPSAFLKMGYYGSSPFDHSMVYCFDVEFYIGLLLNNIKFRKVDDVFSSFRIYPGIKTLSGLEKRYREFMTIEKKFSADALSIFLSRMYKYLSVVTFIRYGRFYPVRLLSGLVNKVFYKLIVGTWGRK